MLRIGSSLENLHIMSLHLGYPVGILTEPIINPHDLSIVAFYAESKEIPGPAALLVQDIRETAGKRVIIDNEDDITPIDDLIRLKEILAIDYDLIGKKVITESKHTLGKVDEFIVNDLDYKIQKLHVKRPAMRSFTSSKLIIDRSQVVATDDKAIIVKDGSEKMRSAKPQLVTSPTN